MHEIQDKSSEKMNKENGPIDIFSINKMKI